MITVPVAKTSKAELYTTIAGVGIAVLGYFFPALVPVLAPLGKLLWAGGWTTAGAGLVQIVKAPS